MAAHAGEISVVLGSLCSVRSGRSRIVEEDAVPQRCRSVIALVALVVASLVGILPARFASAQPATAVKGLPPIIDRDLFFGDPEIAGAQISPDGRFIAFLKPFKGTRNIWVKS